MGENAADQQQVSPEPAFYKLDDITLERHALTYPEAMRDPFLWLGCFVREACRRDLGILVERAKPLGIDIHRTTWARILTGKWDRDKAGVPLASPVLALEKFVKVVGLLKEDHRLKELAGRVPFVDTATSQLIFDYIECRRAPERVNRFGIIVGHTGSQKTASFQEYVRRNNHGLCVWLEAPENGSRKEFITALAVKYGASPSDAYDALRRKVIMSVNDRKTIIIDNAQCLYKQKDGTRQPIFDFLRRLQDETKCTIILSITPEFHRSLLEHMMRNYFEQFEGRAGGVRGFLILDEYPPEDDCVAIAKAFGLRDADKHADYLVKLARERGRIRILFEELQQAKVTAEANREKLTLSHLKALREDK